MPDQLGEEARAALDQAAREHGGFPEIAWFVKGMERAFQEECLSAGKPGLIIVGEDFPPELSLAVCGKPRFLLGGSLVTTRWSDALLPRDADPVSRSLCGWLLNDHFDLARQSLVVMTLTNDNRRKLAGLLRARGISVLPVDMPPRCHTDADRSAWADEMLRAYEEMAAFMKVRPSYRRLVQAMEETRRIRKGMLSFQNAALKTPGCMSAALRGIILESAWYAEDRSKWLEHLNSLTSRITAWQKRYYQKDDGRPWVLSIGSPIIFPNEKLPLLLDACGLFLAGRVDALSVQTRMRMPKPRRWGTVKELLLRLARERMPREASGAWTVNQGLLDAMRSRLERQDIDGIVCHVLKGQIEYDFELPKVERIAAEYGVPVFRLETDYQQQDVEQLRIRMEAFSEMLRQRGGERMRLAQ